MFTRFHFFIAVSTIAAVLSCARIAAADAQPDLRAVGTCFTDENIAMLQSRYDFALDSYNGKAYFTALERLRPIVDLVKACIAQPWDGAGKINRYFELFAQASDVRGSSYRMIGNEEIAQYCWREAETQYHNVMDEMNATLAQIDWAQAQLNRLAKLTNSASDSSVGTNVDPVERQNRCSPVVGHWGPSDSFFNGPGTLDISVRGDNTSVITAGNPDWVFKSTGGDAHELNGEWVGLWEGHPADGVFDFVTSFEPGSKTVILTGTIRMVRFTDRDTSPSGYVKSGTFASRLCE